MDVRPGRVVFDHTNGGTFGRAGLSARVCECCERVLGVGQGHIVQLQRASKELRAGMADNVHRSFPI